MHIGIASPISIQKFSNYLYPESVINASSILGLKAPAVDTLVEFFLQDNHYVSIYTLSFEVDKRVILCGPKLKIIINPLRKSALKRAVDLFEIEAKLIFESINSEISKPDILHAHWTYEYAKGVVGFRKSIPIVITIRDWAPRIVQLYPNYYRLSRLILNNRILQMDSISYIANSEYIGRKLKEKWQLEPVFIPNPINDEFLTSKSKTVRESSLLISVSNSLGKGKNIEKLLQAFKLVLREFPKARLLLVGSLFVKDNKQIKLWRGRNLLTNVILQGYIDHNGLIDLYDKASIMVHPSLEESFGNTILEAMARKTTTIGGKNSGAVPFLLGQGDYGIICNIQSVDSIKNSILKLLRDEHLRLELSEKAHKSVLENYTQQKIGEKHINLYKTLLR